MDPLLIFPEEVWEIILHQVEDSTDAWNIFRAFPQLDMNSSLQKKKHLWLFGMIIPNIIPWKFTNWIKEEELLKCRLVCKRWSTDIDKFLENQPQLRAYHPESQAPETFYWNPKSYLEKGDVTDSGFLRNPNYIGGTKFDSYDLNEPKPQPLSQFLKEMETHPPERSPVLSRSLSIVCQRDNMEGEEKRQEFWNDFATVHEKYGEHVWYYHVDFVIHEGEQNYPQIPEAFARLPNLRRLQIDAHEDIIEPYPSVDLVQAKVAALVEAFKAHLPSLPHLESLNIDTSFDKLQELLFSRFSKQIRRLEMHIIYWKPELGQLFPNLTELEVNLQDSKNVPNLKKLLLTLEAPHLAKLQLLMTSEKRGDAEVATSKFYAEDDMFQWIKRFPCLRYLDFGEECRIVAMKERNTLTPENDSIQSLQLLSIRTSVDISYNFLRCLPSLQHLQLYVDPRALVKGNSWNQNKRMPEESQHATMYRSSVWKLLPKLRTLTLLWEEYGEVDIWRKWEFNRESYNNWSQKGGECSTDYGRIREDIRDFLGPHMKDDESDDEYEDEDDSDSQGLGWNIS